MGKRKRARDLEMVMAYLRAHPEDQVWMLNMIAEHSKQRDACGRVVPVRSSDTSTE